MIFTLVMFFVSLLKNLCICL